MLLFALLLSVSAEKCAGVNDKQKHVVVFGGMMKSHHISMVPIIEGLLQQGHRVSYIMPNTTESKSYFPNGISVALDHISGGEGQSSKAKLVYLGHKDWSFDNLFGDMDLDFKNMPFYEKPIFFASMAWNYRKALSKPLLSMHDDLTEWFDKFELDVDAIILHATSFGSKPLIANFSRRTGKPWISILSLPPLPMLVLDDRDAVCRYPNMMKPPSLAELKTSFVTRLKNHMVCRFLQAYCWVACRELDAVFAESGSSVFFKNSKGPIAQAGGFAEFMSEAPNLILYGGPPLSMKIPLKPSQHVVGTIDRVVPQPIPEEMLRWMDRGDANILYISLGTKYELTEFTCRILVDLLGAMILELKIRVLWSLREPQQKKLKDFLLPLQSQRMSDSCRIERFTPQPEVLAHKGVKVFLSHCGWGGVTDATAVGMPILGFPGMQDQFTNARMIEEAGAGIVLADDFSNLVASTKLLLENNAEYMKKSQAAGEALRAYGGLNKTLRIIATVLDGKDPAAAEENDPSAQEMRRTMNEIDPFFEEPQIMEQWASAAIYSVILCMFPFCSLLCCRLCWISCYRGLEQHLGSSSATAGQQKKDQ
jgi:hypothetical protein